MKLYRQLSLLTFLSSLIVVLPGCGAATDTPTDDSTTDTTDDSTEDTTDTTNVDCTQATDFIDVSNHDNYIDWNGDGKTNSDTYAEDLTPSVSVSCSDTTVTVTGNGLINFDFEGVGPAGTTGGGRPSAYDLNMSFPRYPSLAATTTSIPRLGAVGVTVTGIQIYGPNESAIDNYADPFLHGLLEYCGGHTPEYHLHVITSCYFGFTTLGNKNSLLPQQQAGVVLGYAFDGFPILAPYECTDDSCASVTEMHSSYVYSGTGDYANENAWVVNTFLQGAGDLDKCNGRVRPDGSYAYYATSSFPYYLGCYSGTPTTNIRR